MRSVPGRSWGLKGTGGRIFSIKSKCVCALQVVGIEVPDHTGRGAFDFIQKIKPEGSTSEGASLGSFSFSMRSVTSTSRHTAAHHPDLLQLRPLSLSLSLFFFLSLSLALQLYVQINVALVEAHLRCVAFLPRASQPHRVRRGSGTGHKPQDRDDAHQARGGAETGGFIFYIKSKCLCAAGRGD